MPSFETMRADAASDGHGRPMWGRAAFSVGLIGLGLGSIATLLSFLGSWWWFFELFSNFRLQLAVGLALVGLVLGLARSRLVAAAALVLILNAVPVAKLYLAPSGVADDRGPTLKVVAFNILFQERDFSELATYVAAQDADIVAILEATPAALRALTAKLPDHHLIARPRTDAFGMALLAARRPLTADIIALGSSDVPAIEVEFEKEGHVFSLLAIHTFPPVSRENAATRDRMLSLAADWARDQTGHAIVVGDLNATPFSHAYQSFAERGNLVSSQQGFGYQASWPSAMALLRIPIDHLLHSESLVTTARRLGPFLGSDHRPLIVDLALRAN